MDELVATKSLKQLVNNYAFYLTKGIEFRAGSPVVAAFRLKVYGHALADAAEVLIGHIGSAEVYVETYRLLAEIDQDRTL